MIAKAIAYTASDGTVYPSLAEAQAAELRTLLNTDITETAPGQLDHLCKVIVTRREQVLNVLTTTPTSRPSRRRANGYTGHKKRTKQVSPTPNTVAAPAPPVAVAS